METAVASADAGMKHAVKRGAPPSVASLRISGVVNWENSAGHKEVRVIIH